ncbi:OPT oligopeptide transporter [Coniella lustricola]|uniref:OPT oligopeptide transporter n=1 Tax=Coniella lustricola TaxID=2025994 RepID=A0A2T3ALF9_9PEZI|nr:OPT oligopeptide transporter [Coniella lustricola]
MAPGIGNNAIVVGGFNPIENKVIEVPTHEEINEKNAITSALVADPDLKDAATTSTPISDAGEGNESDQNSEDAVIVTGADAARHLLPLRDDKDPAFTFRGMFIATVLCGFQAVIYQIYMFKPTSITISGTFIVLIAYFGGNAWASLLPRGDHLETRWREKNGGSLQANLPLWIRIAKFFNNGPWGIKEHAIAAITATGASNAAAASQVFAAQELFYNMPLSATTVVLSTISIGLFGYGLCGLMRPIAVWHVEAVYWSTLPTVKTLQGLHWNSVKNSKPIRYFWYAYGSMFAYEWFPAYIWPWLNSVSIPCLAAMKATGAKADVLTNLFGGASNNEGLGWLSLSFDWQYTTSFQTSLPLKLQLHQAAGLFVCYFVMLGIYYGNAWGAKSLPFMSTRLLLSNGTSYPTSDVFVGGVLNETVFAEYGPPKLAATFAYSMFIANAAIGALLMHCIIFWGPDIKRTYQTARQSKFDDRHHVYMAKTYKEAPWWWYVLVLVVSFFLGLIVVLREDITLPAWGYVVSLILGIVIAPFSTILYARYGNGIATNNLSKMLAGLMIPGRPVGNMYFAAWSHNVIANAVNLANDLKMGEYLKIPPRVMFLTQIYGTVLGGFINYAVMTSIVSGNRALLANGNGNASWSGATLQAYNTNAASWALSEYLYKAGTTYAMVPAGLGVGAAIVVLHRLVVYFIPRIRTFDLREINTPQFIQYAGYIPYNQSQTCVLLTWVLSGFFCQYYLREYRPRIFKDYMYLVTGAWDGASLSVMFILSFAVFGAGGPSIPFPTWWGNNANGNYDFCPSS